MSDVTVNIVVGTAASYFVGKHLTSRLLRIYKIKKNNIIKKVKELPLQAWTGPEGQRCQNAVP